MTEFEKKLEEEAKSYGIKKAVPLMRSMYPSQSRTEMAIEFFNAFQAGARYGYQQGIEDAVAIAKKESEYAAKNSLLQRYSGCWDVWDKLSRLLSSNPPEDQL